MEHVPYQEQETEGAPRVAAADGSTVRPLAALPGLGSLARFELAPGAVSRAVSHATVQEIWHVVQGGGRMWRRQDGRAEVTELHPGLTLTVPLGTAFQFRADPAGPPLHVVAVTMPPWPADPAAEAAEIRPETGPWPPTIGS
ncbi:cupin domain-containing protein [Kitasatospora sp. NPDC002227]|uniref:cupin domain-containing protein n=1 Tax=Kitasatospora sp. NPDC002227 TaxID=3154773 RepID=UPI00331D7152